MGGLLFFVAMTVAAGLTVLTSTIPVLSTIAIIGALLLLDMLLFWTRVRYYQRSVPEGDITALLGLSESYEPVGNAGLAVTVEARILRTESTDVQTK